ncbi:phage portal protein [Fusobacterium varium]|nr:phage portal protein [Fusobacterium varium]
MTYIDAYDTAVSTSLDDLTDFSDAYLVIKNMSATNADDINDLKKNKVFLIEGDGDAYWLLKQVNDTM